MKIAYIYDVVHPYVAGGVQKRIWELSRRMAHKGHRVTIFGMKHWEGADIICNENVRLWGVCPPRPLFVKGHRSVRESLCFACRVLPPLLKERFDIIDCQNFPYFPCFSGAFHSVTRRSRLIITWHEVWDNYWFDYLGNKGVFGKMIERLIARLPHEAIAVSDTTGRGLAKLGRRNARIVPDGADIAAIAAISPSSERSDIIFAGRLIREKNVSLLIKAVSLIRKNADNIRCLIIGNGPERESLEKLVRDFNLTDNVHFKGHLDLDAEVISLVKASQVFVFPSIREGFGIAAVEANACGIPVITVRHSRNAVSDLITDGENGFICEPSEKDVAQSILRALGHENNWKPKCKEIASRYDWDQIADLLEQVYQKTVGIPETSSTPRIPT
jgi:glycosyltransferase involved in cell wall biosynthesis